MTDRAITEIEEAAHDYEDVKLTRMEWTTKETKANEALVAAMHRHKRSIYIRKLEHGGRITVRCKEGRAKASVAIKESAGAEA